MMKRYISLFVFFLSILSIWAAPATETEQKKAIELYKSAKYDEVISIYETMLIANHTSPVIYYNLGNAYYKSGQVARAILNYERALQLDPSFEDAKFNIELAKTKLVDKIDDAGEFVFVRIINAISSWMSSNTWGVLSIALFVLSLISVLAYAFVNQLTIRKIGFFGSVVAISFAFIAFYMSYNQKSKIVDQDFAIIMSPSVTVTSTPDEKGTKLFVLHEGVKVKVESTLDTWVEIKLSDGNVGWIKLNDIERI